MTLVAVGVTVAAGIQGWSITAATPAAAAAYPGLAWGANAAGHLGIGDVTVTNALTPVGMARGQIGPAEAFASIDGGELSACGVGTGNWVYCWGAGGGGRLGNGGTTTYSSPQAIAQGSIPVGTHFASVSAGREYGCARSTVGGLYCWGSNDSGQLGYGLRWATALVPGSVSDGQKPANDTWTAVAAGIGTTCGIASDDSAYCWGENASGQLGTGVTGGVSLDPQLLAVPGPWRSITVGNQHACAIAGDDSAYCWGNNSYGQLGIGTNDAQKNQPTLVVTANLLAGETFASLSAGSATTCGTTSAGRILCWGSRLAGALGDGSGNSSNIPVATAPPTGVPGGVTYSAVTVGDFFACGLGATGVAYCWGMNSSGQLGDGTIANRSVPTAVVGSGSPPFTGLSAGAYAVFATFTPGAPGAPVLTSASTTQTTATITFTPGSDGGATITNYEYSLDGGGWSALVPADDSSPLTITDLTGGTTYDVQLRAVNGVAPGAASNTLSVTTESAPTPTPAPPVPVPINPPGVPLGVTAVPADRSVTASWSPPVEAGWPPVVGYQVESTEPGAACTTSATSCVIAGLVNGREYAFRVRAVSDSAVGAWSAWTAKVTPVGVPSAPASVVAVAGDDTALVSWQAPGDDGGSPILTYTVSATPGTASCTVTSQTCEVSGLTNGATYTFTVVATNAAGSSAASAPSNAVTPERRVEPSILISGSRSLRASGDRVTIIGVTTGLVGSEAQAWVKASGRKDFSRRGEPVVIGETERFRWTGTIRRAAQVYFAAGDVRSNKITLPRR